MITLAIQPDSVPRLPVRLLVRAWWNRCTRSGHAWLSGLKYHEAYASQGDVWPESAKLDASHPFDRGIADYGIHAPRLNDNFTVRIRKSTSAADTQGNDDA